MNEILRECQSVVDNICKKYNYNVKDEEGNDSLRTVLLKAIPIMLQDSKLEDRKLFYRMLEHTPIVITENLDYNGYKKLKEQYIGNINTNIEEEKTSNLGEYEKNIGVGAYVSDAILDENLQLKGKKSFLYIQKANKRAREFLGTDINVPHLIHELGHAWHAEENEYTMQDSILKQRVGTAELFYSFHKGNDGKIVKKCDSSVGVMIEEGMNTIAEEKAMAEYANLSMEEMAKKYKEVLIPSNYQGYISSLVKYMIDKLLKENFNLWRLHGDERSKSRIESIMEKTSYWKNREKEIQSGSESPRNYDIKRNIISRVKSKNVQEFFKQYESTYFPNISKLTPLEKIDNVLFQKYNMNMIRYNMGIDNYSDFLNCLNYEGYSLINQSADILRNEISSITKEAKLSDINKATTEAKEFSKLNNHNLQNDKEH